MEIESFLYYLENIKRYSPKTLCAYREDLEQFSAYCKTINDIRDYADITPKIIRDWVVLKMSEGLNPRSIKRKVSTLRSYFKYLLREGKVEENPTETVITPKCAKRLPVYVPGYQMDELLDGDDIYQDNFSGMRDRLVLLTAYMTGMRLSELVNMKLRDLDISNHCIRVLGKGNKERLIPVAEELREEMDKYIDSRRQVVEEEHGYFFVTDKGHRVYDKFIYRLVHRYLSLCTTLSKQSPHVLRHTFATHLLNNGACIEAIKELLGHSDLTATQVYTHNSFENLIKVFNHAHPRA